jgi:formylmethanofuran dehydrogenase subunit E
VTNRREHRIEVRAVPLRAERGEIATEPVRCTICGSHLLAGSLFITLEDRPTCPRCAQRHHNVRAVSPFQPLES